jgi:hypothetical protein
MEPRFGGARVSVTEVATNARGRSRQQARRPRSAVTSGRKLFVQGDPNSAWARRFHDLVLGHVSDLGGRSNMSEAQFALVKKAAALETETEQLEGRMSLGEEVDLNTYGRAASHLRRILETLGLERKARDALALDAGDIEVFTPMRARLTEAERVTE